MLESIAKSIGKELYEYIEQVFVLILSKLLSIENIDKCFK